MEQNDLTYLQNRIDYRFKNIKLLEQAFIRRSYSAENGEEDNEVLEFIGDKALDYAIVKYLAEKHGMIDPETGYYLNRLDEGKLTERKAYLVQKKTLAKRIDYLGLAEFLQMGQGDMDNEAYKQASVKEDLFEAILGAVALDSGWDIKALSHTIEIMLDPDTELGDDEYAGNYVGELQDWALKKEGVLPVVCIQPYSRSYLYNGERYIRSGDIMKETTSRYMCSLRLRNYKDAFLGFGNSEKEARMDAAKLALEQIEKDGLMFSIRDELEDPNFEESISQLEVLARRGYFSVPTYDFKETHDSNGNPSWDVKCHISEYDKVTRGTSSSKKEAKKMAAFQMLQYVLEEG